MFPDYEPPEPLQSAVSQAAIVAADIDPETRSISVVVHSPGYIPRRLMDLFTKEICQIYGLRSFQLTSTHPADQLGKMEPGELMQMFVLRNSMTRGSLAGAQWTWNGNALHIKLLANGKDAVEELIPQERFPRRRYQTP